MQDLEKLIRHGNNMSHRANIASGYISNLSASHRNISIDYAIERILKMNGMITVASLCSELSVSERYIEQIFQKYIGLSPKFYTRIIRFNYIFQLVKDKATNWADVVYEAGYYDQSHFIRNFKAFTGEDPTTYLFSEKNLANFFLKK